MSQSKTVRMEDLTPDEQRLVRALIAAADAGKRARAERDAQNPPPIVTDPEAVQRVAAICRSRGEG
jgi:hypothetical protein